MISPPGFKAIKGLGLHSQNPPIGLAYIAAMLKKNSRNYKVIDMAGLAIDRVTPYHLKKNVYLQGLSIDQAIAMIPEKTGVVGLSCMFSMQWPIIVELTQEIRKRLPRALIVAGGEHVTALPEFCLQHSELNAVVMGEGEFIFLRLINAFLSDSSLSDIPGLAFKDNLSGGIVLNHRDRRIDNLDSIPWPDWDSIPMETYIRADLQNGVNRGRSMPIVATRGCPFRCTFCSNRKMWGSKYRARNPEDVVAEMKSYVEKYQVTNFNFQDLTAFVNKKWVLKLSDEILKQGLCITWQLPSGTRIESFDEEVARSIYRSGCRNIAFAPESASPQILRDVKKELDAEQMKKAIRAAVTSKLNLSCFFVVGFPTETRHTLKTTLSYVRRLARLGVADIGVTQFVPYPGSELFEEFLREGKIVIDNEFLLSPFDFYVRSNRCYADEFTSHELYRWQLKLLANFYLFSILYHPLKALSCIAKAVFLRKEETRYAKFITDVLYRRVGMFIKSKRSHSFH